MTKILSTRQTDAEVTSLMDIPSAMTSRSLYWKAQFVQSAAILPHVPLLFWLVDSVRPSVVATLGLDDGVGHFALCQAVDKLDLPAVCLGYDTDKASDGAVSKLLQDHNDAHYDHISQLYALDLKSAVARIGQARVDLILIEVPEAQDDIDCLIRTIPEKMTASGIVVLHGTGRGEMAIQLRNAVATFNPATTVLDFDAGDGISIALLGEETTPRAARLFEQLRSAKSGGGVATTILRRLGASHVLEAQSKTLLADKIKAEAEVAEARRASETAKSRLAELTEAYDLRGRKSAELQARLFDLQQEKIAAQTAEKQSQAQLADLEARIARLEADLAHQVAENSTTRHALDVAQQDLKSALTDLSARADQVDRLEAALASQTTALAEAEAQHASALLASEARIAAAQSESKAALDKNAAALIEAERSLNQRFHELAQLTQRLDKTLAQEARLRDLATRTEAEMHAQAASAQSDAAERARTYQTQLEALSSELSRSETLRQQEVTQLRATLTEQEKDLARVWRDAAKLEERMLKVYASSSWSLTRPLRALTRLLKRSKPAPPFKTRYINTPKAEGSGRLSRVLPVVMREVARPGSLTQEKLVRFLRYQLWGGASAAALPRLEAMLTSPKSTALAKLRAASALSTWYDYSGDPERAMSVLQSLSDQPEEISRDRNRIVRMAVLQANAGRIDEAAATLDTVLDKQKTATDVLLLRANLSSNDGQRLSRINKVYETHGFAPLRRIDGKAPLSLANIETSPVGQTIEDQGLVSVIMPTFNAAATIETSLRSLLAQSYRNIEVIVVDDCSTDDTAQVVERLAKTDPRLRLIRQEKNAGAYPARNRGLTEARGAFLTTHDSDDWSHPQKIEQQLLILADKPKAMGTMTHWARVRPSLEFTTNWRLSDEVVHWSHSSLLFRRSVFEKLGGWDNVRVSGDTEFIWRIEAAYGRYSVPRIHKQVPLAFALDDDSSLTRTKLTHVSTTYYGLRHYYREISRYWLSKHPKGLTEAAKAAKWAMLPIEIRERSDGPVAVDLWLKGDMTTKATVAKMESLLRANKGKSIGVTHVTDPLLERDVPSYAALFCNEFFEFLQSSGARIVLPGVEVKTEQVLDLNSQRK